VVGVSLTVDGDDAVYAYASTESVMSTHRSGHVFGDRVVAVAMIDRTVHRAEIIT
jgi:hypothetical protein